MLLVKVEHIQVEVNGKLLFAVPEVWLSKGEKIGLIGRNGCGKSTFLRLLTGEMIAETGKVELFTDYAYVPQREAGETTLSGGQAQIRRVKRAAAQKAPLLLLDEPTAHLDEQGATEVQRILAGYGGSVLVVSHDRTLLDGVCTAIWAIEDGRLHVYRGNYTDYERQRQAAEEKHRQDYGAYRAEAHRLAKAAEQKHRQAEQIKRVPRRFGNGEARLHKMGGQSAKKRVDMQAKALRTRLTQLEKVEKPWSEKPVRIGIPEGLVLRSAYPLVVKELDVFAGERQVLSDVSFQLSRHERLGIAGENGSGKTSLLKAIMAKQRGVWLSGGVVPGYFRQDLSLLDDSLTVLENLMEGSSLLEWELRSLLAGMHVPDERINDQAKVLSGGERVKVSLLKVMTGGNNLLILDEPTNFLDLPSLEALEGALLHCDKPMLLVSHDRALLKAVCTRTVICADGRVFERREPAKQCDDTAVLRLRQTAVLSRLCMERDEGKKRMLEEEYQAICALLLRVKGK